MLCVKCNTSISSSKTAVLGSNYRTWRLLSPGVSNPSMYFCTKLETLANYSKLLYKC